MHPSGTGCDDRMSCRAGAPGADRHPADLHGGKYLYASSVSESLPCITGTCALYPCHQSGADASGCAARAECPSKGPASDAAEYCRICGCGHQRLSAGDPSGSEGRDHAPSGYWYQRRDDSGKPGPSGHLFHSCRTRLRGGKDRMRHAGNRRRC